MANGPPVSRFGAFRHSRYGIYCLKVCNASGAVLGLDPAGYGFGPFWYPRGGFCTPPEQKRLAQSVAPRSGGGKRSAAALTAAEIHLDAAKTDGVRRVHPGIDGLKGDVSENGK